MVPSCSVLVAFNQPGSGCSETSMWPVSVRPGPLQRVAFTGGEVGELLAELAAANSSVTCQEFINRLGRDPFQHGVCARARSHAHTRRANLNIRLMEYSATGL